jgi:hypothetical protein
MPPVALTEHCQLLLEGWLHRAGTPTNLIDRCKKAYSVGNLIAAVGKGIGTGSAHLHMAPAQSHNICNCCCY